MFEIPLQSGNQTFRITLGTTVYTLTVMWRDPVGYFLDIADASGDPLVQGIAMVTGLDLLSPFEYLMMGGTLTITSDGPDPTVPPTYANLGTGSHLYWTPA